MKKLILTLFVSLIALVSRAAAPDCWFFEGKMGGRISVELCITTCSDHPDIVAGYIYYPDTRQPKPILVAGTIDDDNFVTLREYIPDGTVTGILRFTVKRNGRFCSIVNGEWTNPRTLASYSLATLRQALGMPKWWPGNPLTPADAASIPGTYEFSMWNPKESGMGGGSAEFSAVPGGDLRFTISNWYNNVAEVESEPDRPALLRGNEMQYGQANDCGYSFLAIFFTRFVVVSTTSDPSSYGCFGYNASPDGVYIRTSSRK